MSTRPPTSEPEPSGDSTELSEELFARWRDRGEETAARKLAGRYESRLVRLIERRLPPDVRRRFGTRDLVQETMARAIGGAGEFEDRGKGSLWAWVRGITNHVVHDLWRRNARERAADVDLDDSYVHPPTPEEPPIAKLEADERGRLIASALAELRERERRAVLLRCEMGMSYKAVATALDYPSTDAARMAVRRALDQVGERLVDASRS